MCCSLSGPGWSHYYKVICLDGTHMRDDFLFFFFYHILYAGWWFSVTFLCTGDLFGYSSQAETNGWIKADIPITERSIRLSLQQPMTIHCHGEEFCFSWIYTQLLVCLFKQFQSTALDCIQCSYVPWFSSGWMGINPQSILQIVLNPTVSSHSSAWQTYQVYQYLQ